MTDTTATPRRPRAFRLETPVDPAREAPNLRAASASVQIETAADDAFEATAAQPEGEQAIEVAQARGMLPRSFSWGGLFWTSVTGLVGLGFSLWLWRMIEDLFARVEALGWVAAALAGFAALALVALAIRETRAIFRQKRIAQLHQDFAAARAADDTARARGLVRDLAALYGERADTARARSDLAALSTEIVDGRDLIDIAERSLVQELDARAQREIALAARRVSVVTAVSPRAALDILFVAAQAVRLVRRISEIYGGRPGLLGFVRLARSVGAHLAITGGMAVGDSLLQQVVGHGIAAKLSAKLGEGVLNGLLTARVGLSAMAVCRPMPFAADPQPGVSDVAPFLFGGADKG